MNNNKISVEQFWDRSVVEQHHYYVWKDKLENVFGVIVMHGSDERGFAFNPIRKISRDIQVAMNDTDGYQHSVTGIEYHCEKLNHSYNVLIPKALDQQHLPKVKKLIGKLREYQDNYYFPSRKK